MANESQRKRMKKVTKKYNSKWIISISIWTFILAVFVSIISENLLRNINLILAFLTLLFIILVGILFDAIGIAVASANEKPFHSMASNRIIEAKYAVKLVRNAVPVSNFCNDVIGDICGIISGAAGGLIILEIIEIYGISEGTFLSILMSSLIASLTVGGKAIGKEIAMKNSSKIIIITSKLLMTLDLKFGIKLLPELKKKKQ